jgi:hypothetical protein
MDKVDDSRFGGLQLLLKWCAPLYQLYYISVSINRFNFSQFSFIDALFIRRVMSSANDMTPTDECLTMSIAGAL